ncbi:cadherin domain protein [Teladorsagia circumcincta]|uniref:Cadherin domain protein n=1 Tax=Teladorsagia circumcincta TaxID=45464 RepID=A0A2G9TKD5_TELCI|nr:cadherin domain protein [Teladorsagia circumcincta]
MDVNLKDSYTLEVLVHLPPPSIHTVTATVTVTVTDVNNHPPLLIDLPDRLSISENTTVGSVVFTAKATDRDRGDNARLLYRLLSGMATEYLSIDSTSGKITLRKAVDFETIQGFDVEIEVCDRGHSELCTATILPAVIQPLHLNATYNVRMKEDARPGTVLIKLGNYSFYVFKSGLKTPVDAFPDGTVYLKKPIDNAGPDVISLPVTATHRFLNNTYSTMVHVFIDDVNDHCPQCSQRKEFTIEENLSVGSTIGFLEAYDDDIGLNGVIGYRLLDNQNLIRIGTATGKITTATVFDAETLTKIDFKYEVYDHGSPSRAVVCNATIVITDVNDNAPVFDRDVYTAAINVNNLSENRTIAIVMARDEDRSSEIVYKLLNYLHLFEVGRKNLFYL